MKMTCLIIDDERLARTELRSMLLSYSEITVLGEAKNAEEAKALIEQVKPDFIFLDIQMPGASGFDILHNLTFLPKVVFVTAFDQFAIQAFEHNALDYLLKPISEERLQMCIARLQQVFNISSGKNQNYLNHIFLPDKKQFQLITTAQICHIQSIGNYAQIHTANYKGLLKTSLNQLEQQLDPNVFFRINRSAIINTRQIEKVWPNEKTLRVLLNNRVELQMSERKSVEFRRRIKI